MKRKLIQIAATTAETTAAVLAFMGNEASWNVLLAWSVFQLLTRALFTVGPFVADAESAEKSVNKLEGTWNRTFRWWDCVIAVLVAATGHVGWAVVWFIFPMNSELVLEFYKSKLKSKPESGGPCPEKRKTTSGT